MGKLEDYLISEAVKFQKHPQFSKVKMLNNFKGLKRVYIFNKRGFGWAVSTSYPCKSLDDMVEVDGEYWFGTLKSLKTAIENEK